MQYRTAQQAEFDAVYAHLDDLSGVDVNTTPLQINSAAAPYGVEFEYLVDGAPMLREVVIKATDTTPYSRDMFIGFDLDEHFYELTFTHAAAFIERYIGGVLDRLEDNQAWYIDDQGMNTLCIDDEIVTSTLYDIADELGLRLEYRTDQYSVGFYRGSKLVAAQRTAFDLLEYCCAHMGEL